MAVETTSQRTHPLFRLGDEDLSMVLAFVLTSGSIKDLAQHYGVSYPTMRQRLDRLIENLKRLTADGPVDPLNEYLAGLIARGGIAPNDAKHLRQIHQAAVESHREAMSGRVNGETDGSSHSNHAES